jgi:predicted nucleic-acid-binding protein
LGWAIVKVTVDTNVLVRAAVLDDPVQSREAGELLANAELIAIPIPVLCEFCWVLKSNYGFPADSVGRSIRHLIAAANVSVEREAAEAGLALLEAGGDFADGVIAHEGRWLGGETFVSFDRKAVRLLEAGGTAAQLLG